MDKIVVSLFDRTTVMVRPWAEAGYTCYCVDIQHPEGEHRDENIIRVGANILSYKLPDAPIKFVAAFPPCTHMATSGARWFKDKGLDALIESLILFNAAIKLCEVSEAAYMIENPVSTISTYYREPDHTFHPWQWGDLWRKKTCLWTGNGFVMPKPTYKREPEGVTDMIHDMAPSPDRGDLRAITPPGFARAVYEANKSPALIQRSLIVV